MDVRRLTISISLERFLEDIKRGAYFSIGYAGGDEFACWYESSIDYYLLDEIVTPAIIRTIAAACPPDTKFSNEDRTMKKVAAAVAVATKWRSDNGYTGRGGVVVVHERTAQSWCAVLPDPNDWSWGSLAVDERGDKAWMVWGDEDQDFNLWDTVDGHK